MKKIIAVLALGALCVAANAKNDMLHLSIADALNSDLAKEKLDSGVKFSFGSGTKGNFIHKDLVANKKANAVGKDDTAACQRAFISALITFAERVKKEGGKRAVNLVSYFKKNTFDSKTEFECAVGSIMVGVALKGDVAK
ncbi:MAG: excinuclease ABC subunit A [Campylobacter sp.]|nr:excinuclease ABC subunit A [Campylobacter sp.]